MVRCREPRCRGAMHYCGEFDRPDGVTEVVSRCGACGAVRRDPEPTQTPPPAAGKPPGKEATHARDLSQVQNAV